jgi:hypothetical protein
MLAGLAVIREMQLPASVARALDVRPVAETQVGAGESGQFGEAKSGLEVNRDLGVVPPTSNRSRLGTASSASPSSGPKKETSRFPGTFLGNGEHAGEVSADVKILSVLDLKLRKGTEQRGVDS